MAKTIVFDARFNDGGGGGQLTDTDISVKIFGSSDPNVPKETRTLGSNADIEIIQSTDTSGVFYLTRVDVSSYTPGPVTAEWTATLNGTPINPSPYVETSPYPQEGVLVLSELKEYIRNMLGYPAINVEMTNSQFATIVDEALSVYNSWLPQTRVTAVTLITGKSSYLLPNLPSRGPYHIAFIRKEGVPLISDPLFGREYPRGHQLDFDQYVLGISFWSTLRRVTSQEPEWDWYEPDKRLFINIGGSDFAGDSGNYFCMVRYFDNVQLERVRPNHFRWFRKYALSQAMQIIGNTRNKFSGSIPAPGGKVQLDGDSMIQRGEAAEEKLYAEVKAMSHVIPPVRG
jgi:hypothetical protein